MKFRLFIATCTFFSILGIALFKFAGPMGMTQILRELKKSVPREALNAGLDGDELAFSYDSIGDIPELARSKFSNPIDTEEKKGPRFTLELEVLKTKMEAERYLDHLKTKGVTAYYSPIHLGSQVVFRVRRGVFSNKSEAGIEGKNLSHAAGIKSKVVLLR